MNNRTTEKYTSKQIGSWMTTNPCKRRNILQWYNEFLQRITPVYHPTETGHASDYNRQASVETFQNKLSQSKWELCYYFIIMSWFASKKELYLGICRENYVNTFVFQRRLRWKKTSSSQSRNFNYLAYPVRSMVWHVTWVILFWYYMGDDCTVPRIFWLLCYVLHALSSNESQQVVLLSHPLPPPSYPPPFLPT